MLFYLFFVHQKADTNNTLVNVEKCINTRFDKLMKFTTDRAQLTE